RVVRRVTLTRVVQVAEERGWWTPLANVAGEAGAAPRPSALPAPGVVPTMLASVSVEALDRLVLGARVLPPLDPMAAQRLIEGAAVDGASLSAAVVDVTLVALAVSSSPG